MKSNVMLRQDKLLHGLLNRFCNDDYWLKQLPLFLRLRELIVYIGCFRSWDGDETFSSSDNQWFKVWIYESERRIEAEEAIVDIWSL